MKRLLLPTLVLGLLAAACAQEGPVSPAFEATMTPAFAVVNSCTAEGGCFQVEVCKVGLLPPDGPGQDDGGPDPQVVGTYTFRYSWDGPDADDGSFTLDAVTNFPDGCVEGTAGLLVPNSAANLLIEEMVKTFQGGFADVWLITSTPEPGCIVEEDVGQDGDVAGSAAVDLANDNCVGGKIYFKNTFVEGEREPAVGRITGGGVQFNEAGARITKGFTLHCDIKLSNNLEINWPRDGENGMKDANNWHITRPLGTAECIDDPNINHGQPAAPFDIFIGTGFGKLNGVEGAYIEFTLIDRGEPGKNDSAAIKIWAPGADPETDDPVLVVDSYLKGGNFQVHCDQPHGSRGQPCLASDTDT